MRNKLIIIFLVLIQYNVIAQVKISDIKPNEYFDFWIGNWDLTWQNSNNELSTGENHIFKTLNNKIIEENFNVIKDPNINGFVGKSWSVYDKNNNTWYQTWVDNQGAYLDFIGEIEGDKRIFKREFSKPDGTIILQRMVFYNIETNSFTWDWENSLDNGKTWKLQWRINYVRKKP